MARPVPSLSTLALAALGDTTPADLGPRGVQHLLDAMQPWRNANDNGGFVGTDTQWFRIDHLFSALIEYMRWLNSGRHTRGASYETGYYPYEHTPNPFW